MSEAKDTVVLLNVLTGSTEEPDYPKQLASFKAALCGYAASIKRGNPKDELRRIFIQKIAGLDDSYVHGGGEGWEIRAINDHTVKVLASCYAGFYGYLAVQNLSDEEAIAMRRNIADIREQTAPRTQVKNVKHALRVDRAERNKGKKKPGGQRKPGGLRKEKVVMRAIRCKKDAYARAGKKVPGVLKLLGELREAGQDIPWKDGYMKNRYSMWDHRKDDFRKKPAHGS